MSTPDNNPTDPRDDAEDSSSEQPASGEPNVDEHFIDAANNPDAQAPSSNNEDSASQTPADVAMNDQLAAALQERDANHERWLRAQAELENYRRRSNKEISEVRQYQSLTVIRDLLPATDNLKRALDAAEGSQNFDEFVTGIKMIVQQLEGVLASHNASPIQAIDQPFDPNLHEAIQHMPSPDHPAMTVMQEVETGYVMHDRVIRPSKVLVSSGPPVEAEES